MIYQQNSTNVLARNITCRGGIGLAFGSLGQYVQFVRSVLIFASHVYPDDLQNDIIDHVVLEDLRVSGTSCCMETLTDNQISQDDPPRPGGAAEHGIRCKLHILRSACNSFYCDLKVYFKTWTGTIHGSPPTGGGGGGGMS